MPKARRAARRGAPRAKPLSTLLVKRVSILLLVLCLVSGFFWTVGSFTEFLDETQVLLLTMLRLSGLALALAASVGIALLLAFSFARLSKPNFLGVIGYLLLCGIGAASLFLADAVLLLFRGVGSP